MKNQNDNQLYYRGEKAEYTGEKSYEDGTRGPKGWYYQFEVKEGPNAGYVSWTMVKP